MPRIRTVLGDIAPSQLGKTHSHETVIDLWDIVGSYEPIVDEEHLIVYELDSSAMREAQRWWTALTSESAAIPAPSSVFRKPPA